MSTTTGKIGSADVARLAGVSRSAVSRTFTEGAYVSPETREKVLQAADTLGYRPNVLARSLTTNRTHIIGIITADLDNPFYAELLKELISRLQDRGLAPFVLAADHAGNDDLVARLLSYQVDGVILTNTHLSSEMALKCARSGKPVIMLNRYVDIADITAITCDNVAAGGQVAELFLELGRERIAFIAGDPDTSSSRDREQGFRAALAAKGASLHSCATGFYTHEGGQAATRELFSGRTVPDAIFAANDLMALAAIDVIRSELHLRVPEDVCIVGFDNSRAARWPAYELTSVDQNKPRMVDVAVEEITARLAGERSRSRHYNVSGRLIQRDSTKIRNRD